MKTTTANNSSLMFLQLHTTQLLICAIAAGYSLKFGKDVVMLQAISALFPKKMIFRAYELLNAQFLYCTIFLQNKFRDI